MVANILGIYIEIGGVETLAFENILRRNIGIGGVEPFVGIMQFILGIETQIH